MDKQELTNKVMDTWTDNFYTDIRDIVFTYTLEYEAEELDDIIEKVIEKMLKQYNSNDLNEFDKGGSYENEDDWTNDSGYSDVFQ